MKFLLWLLLFSPAAFSTTVTKATTITINAGSSACPVTVGTLTLRAQVNRSSGISPLLVWVDATATTDSATLGGVNNPFQDIAYTLNYGDTGASGTGKWIYGSNGTATGGSGNSKNTATGAIGAHLYIVPDGQGDTTFTPTITAFDGTNTASCTVAVTAFDPTASNGFSAANTTCVNNSTQGSGCPAGATILNASSWVTALSSAFGSNKRVLFKCGDTFSASTLASVSATKARIGAYGTCAGTQASRPIFNNTGAVYAINISPTSSDVAVSDIDFQGNNTAHGAVSLNGGPTAGNPSQITLLNLNSNGNAQSVFWSQGTQMGAVQITQQNSTNSGISLYLNSNQNNCANGNTTFQCGQGGSAVYNNVTYQALMGSFINGPNTGASGSEVVRMGAGIKWVIENNTAENATTGTSLFKIHDGNSSGTLNPWLGQPNEYGELSDNLGTGQTASCFEVAPQNGIVDERLFNIITERNLCAMTLTTAGGGSIGGYQSGQNLTYRDNVFWFATGAGTSYAQFATFAITRGGTTYPAWQSTANEFYNNTCYNPNPHSGQSCISNSGTGAATNSFFQNNMLYTVGASGFSTIVTGGTGNTVTPNTTTSSNNPGFTNGSTTFLLLSDYKPTANFTGGTSVPNFYDALGIAWSPTWDLGAVHH